jgi:hypothetical protein
MRKSKHPGFSIQYPGNNLYSDEYFRIIKCMEVCPESRPENDFIVFERKG